ncbi:MAG TPA: PAS domain S-box protein, partial [bacterium]|nr:PAS domain S-box protein [bacterium]
IDDLYRRTVELGLTRLGFDRLGIWLCSPENPGEILGTFGTDFSGHVQDERGMRVTVPKDHFLAALVFGNQPLVTDIRFDEKEDKSAPIHCAAASIYDGERTFGIIRTDNVSSHVRPFPQQSEILRLLASTLGALCSLKRAEEALRYSDEIYRTAIEKASGVPYRLRYKDWRYEFVGSGAQALLGIPNDQLTLDLMSDMIQDTTIPHPDGTVSSSEYANAFLRGERDLYQVDIRIVTPDGQSKWISDTAIPLKDSRTGDVYGSLGILQDITERKHVEWQLRENNRRLVALNSVAQVTLGTLSPEKLCDNLAEVFRSLMPCDACVFDLYDSGNDVVSPMRLYDTVQGIFQTVPSVQAVVKPTGTMRRVIEERSPSLIHRKKPKQERAGFIGFGDASRPSASLLFAPMIAGDRVMGVLSIQSYTFNAYKESDLDLLASIAQQIGPAFEAALLSDEIRTREEQERAFGRQLATLVEVTNDLSAAETLDEMIAKAVQQGHHRLGFDRLGIWLLDSENLEFIQGTFGIDENGTLRDERSSRMKWHPTSVMGQVLAGESGCVLSRDAPLFDNAAEVVGTGMQAVVAIQVGQTILGCLSIDNLIHGQEITEQHCEVLRLFASALGALTTSKRARQELVQTHHIYREAIQNAHGVPYLLNYTTGKYDFMGSGCEVLLGVTPDELSYDLMERMVVESRPTAVGGETDPAKIVQSFIDGKVDRYQSDIRVRTPQGEEKWLSDSSISVRDPRTGRVTNSIGILQDITQRKQIEEALRESEAQFRAVAETTPSALFVIQDDRFAFVNPATAEITGYPMEELLQMHFWEFVHPDDQETVRQRSYSRREGGLEPNRYECRIVTKEGQTKWLDISVSLVELEGRPAVITVAFEISERKRIEEEREALRRLSQALTAPLTLREIARMIADECRRFFQYDAFWFDVYDSARRLFPGTYTEDTPVNSSTPIEVETSTNVVEGMTASVVLEGRAYRVDCDTDMNNGEASSSMGFVSSRTRSIICAPILWQGRGVGIISVQSHTTGKYTDSDLSLLHSFADQCGGALHRI